MSDHIKLLPDSIANQIAAGEVVNRPASVVKELMENAVDAGAGAVTVNFRDGGRELIQLRDDGCGMSPQDARMAFERHATSKITSAEDIYTLMTFGFRGEALASIAAVAQVEMVTRRADSELGTRLRIDGGMFAGQSPDAAPGGTQIWVRNLFYNVPARKKFLDRASTESNHIITEFQRVALAHPEIAFQLYRDDAPVYNLPVGNLHTRVVGIMGRGSASKLLDVEVETSIARVWGFAGRPAAAKRRGRDQFLFVNGRFFKSAFFHKAVIQAYEKLIPTTVQPPYFIYLDIDPGEIDVNVHPQKTEVKFTNQSAVWQIINAAVRETLAKSGSVPMMDFDDEERLEIPALGTQTQWGSHQGGNHTGEWNGSAPRSTPGEGGEERNHPPAISEPAVVRDTAYNPFTKYNASEPPRVGGGAPPGEERLREIEGIALDHARGEWDDAPSEWSAARAQHSDTSGRYGLSSFDYIPSSGSSKELQSAIAGFDSPKLFSRVTPLGEGYASALYGGVFVVIDLRRAREAVLFEHFHTMLRSGHSATQQLLFAERMALTADDAELMKDCAGEFTAMGFNIRSVGEGIVEIVGVPADMPHEGLQEAIYEMLDTLREGTFEGERQRRERLAAVMAHSGAALGGRSQGGARHFSDDETAALLSALASAQNPSFTPWGKAVMVEITLDELRAKLG